MVTVSSGEKIVCSGCGKTICSDIKTRQVKEADVSDYTVREIKEICNNCQVKIEKQQREAEEQRKKAKEKAERQRRIERKSKLTGTWRASAPIGTITIVLNSDGTGIEAESGFGSSDRIKWHLDGNYLVIKDPTGTIRCPLSDDWGSFTFSGREVTVVFTRS